MNNEEWGNPWFDDDVQRALYDGKCGPSGDFRDSLPVEEQEPMNALEQIDAQKERQARLRLRQLGGQPAPWSRRGAPPE